MITKRITSKNLNIYINETKFRPTQFLTYKSKLDPIKTLFKLSWVQIKKKKGTRPRLPILLVVESRKTTSKFKYAHYKRSVNFRCRFAATCSWFYCLILASWKFRIINIHQKKFRIFLHLYFVVWMFSLLITNVSN